MRGCRREELVGDLQVAVALEASDACGTLGLRGTGIGAGVSSEVETRSVHQAISSAVGGSTTDLGDRESGSTERVEDCLGCGDCRVEATPWSDRTTIDGGFTNDAFPALRTPGVRFLETDAPEFARTTVPCVCQRDAGSIQTLGVRLARHPLKDTLEFRVRARVGIPKTGAPHCSHRAVLTFGRSLTLHTRVVETDGALEEALTLGWVVTARACVGAQVAHRGSSHGALFIIDAYDTLPAWDEGVAHEVSLTSLLGGTRHTFVLRADTRVTTRVIETLDTDRRVGFDITDEPIVTPVTSFATGDTRPAFAHTCACAAVVVETLDARTFRVAHLIVFAGAFGSHVHHVLFEIWSTIRCGIPKVLPHVWSVHVVGLWSFETPHHQE